MHHPNASSGWTILIHYPNEQTNMHLVFFYMEKKKNKTYKSHANYIDSGFNITLNGAQTYYSYFRSTNVQYKVYTIQEL